MVIRAGEEIGKAVREAEGKKANTMGVDVVVKKVDGKISLSLSSSSRNRSSNQGNQGSSSSNQGNQGGSSSNHNNNSDGAAGAEHSSA